MDYEMNRYYVNQWYKQQKNNGIVYCLYVEGAEEVYIGSTTNSIKKRLWQHRANLCSRLVEEYKSKYGDNLLIKVLWESSRAISKDTLKEIEQAFIEQCPKAINIREAIAKDKRKHCYKGGVKVFGEYFPTILAAWEKYGEVPLGTVKSRLHRGIPLEEALLPR